MTWGSEAEVERRRRILLSVWAYAYEVRDDPLVDDGKFDEECSLVDTWVLTGNDRLDNFFMKHFDSSTGMWIRNHPELDRIKQLYDRVKDYG